MKFVIFLLVWVEFGLSAPRRTEKLFCEHFEDFLQLIVEESGHELELLLSQYVRHREFVESINYLQTNDFMDIVRTTESLSEFRAMVQYLEENNIDMIYFIDMLNQLLGTFHPKKNTQQPISGRNVTSYMKDSIKIFPKEKLAHLFIHKMVEHEEFKATIDKLRSEEWRHIFNALWKNKTFKENRHILAQYGIDVSVLVKVVMAVFGQI